jgi:tetratricopeptide (TPR) repeat protein
VSERAFDICTRECETESVTSLSVAKARGLSLVAARRVGEALPAFDRAYGAASRVVGPSDHVTVDLRARRAVALAHNRRAEEARREMEAVAEEAGRAQVIPAWRVLYFQGLVERELGSYAAALDLQERALPLASNQPVRQGLTLLQIGMLRLDLGKRRESRQALEEGGRLLAETDDRFDPDDAEVLVGLGRLALDEGRPAEAAERLQEAERFWRDFDAENPWAGEVSFWLSRAYRSLGRLRASEAARRRAVAILSRLPDPSAARLVRLAMASA